MIPKWLWGKRIAIYDIETDWIPTTQIFTIGVAILEIDTNGTETITPSKAFTQYWVPYSNGSLMQAVTLINSCDFVSGHNIISFDTPELRKHLSTLLRPRPLDTLILSKIVFSKDDLFAMDPQLRVEKDMWGSYSLKAFGQRMGDFKIDFHDFSGLTPEMVKYCNQDVDLTAQLLVFLFKKENFPIEPVVDIEHKAAEIIQEQTEFGFYIDIDMARALNTKLLQEKGEIARELATIFKPKFLQDGQVKTYKKKSQVKKYLPNEHYKKVW